MRGVSWICNVFGQFCPLGLSVVLVASCDIPLDGGYHHIHIIWQECPTLDNISYSFFATTFRFGELVFGTQ